MITGEKNSVNGRRVRKYSNYRRVDLFNYWRSGNFESHKCPLFFFIWLRLWKGNHVGKDTFKCFWCGHFCFLDPWITSDWNQKSGWLLLCININILFITLLATEPCRAIIIHSHWVEMAGPQVTMEKNKKATFGFCEDKVPKLRKFCLAIDMYCSKLKK